MDIDKLNKWADLLLDTGKRNNLINFKDTKLGTVEIVCPDFDALFSKAEHSAVFEVYDPKLDDLDDEEINEVDEQVDNGKSTEKAFSKEEYIGKYKSRLKKNGQILIYNAYVKNPLRCLRNVEKKAKTAIEETGVNIAYMAFGFINWTEDDSVQATYRAPILLAPISIQSESAIEPYCIKIMDSEIIVNPTFSFKMKNDYGIELPDYDDENVDDYLNKIASVISKLKWTITKECKIGIFSFLKINMHKDLKDNAEKILRNNGVRSLLGESDVSVTVENVAENSPKEELQLYNVVDADSSQAEAIELARSGKSFVLQGPPGTGKSQTITNVIAEFLADGKKVLFVSEKLAALNVVYGKLKTAGLEEFCLELHSHKANKKDVIEELCQTLKGQKSGLSMRAQREIDSKLQAQKELDEYVDELHKTRPEINKSLYNLYDEVSACRNAPEVGHVINEIKSKGEEYIIKAETELSRYVDYIPSIGYDYHQNVWYGYEDLDCSYETVARLKEDLIGVISLCQKIMEISEGISKKYSISVKNLNQAYALKEFFNIVKTSEFVTPSWLNSSNHVGILKTVKEMQALANEILKYKESLDQTFDEDVYKIDGQLEYKKLTKQFGSVFTRMFSGEYITFANKLRLCHKYGSKIKYKTAVCLMDDLRVYQQKLYKFKVLEEKIKNKIGAGYSGVTTNFELLNLELETISKAHTFNVDFSVLVNQSTQNFVARQQEFSLISDSFNSAFDEFGNVEKQVFSKFNQEKYNVRQSKIEMLLKKLKGCVESVDKLDNWCEFIKLLDRLKHLELKSFVRQAIKQRVKPEDVVSAYKKIFYSQWINVVLHESPALIGLTRIRHDQIIKLFKSKDVLNFEINKAKIKAKLSAERPNLDMVAQGSAIAILLREGEKKRKQKGIRLLLEEIGDLVQTLKPCFLMSPLSVSTFLSSEMKFDVVIFDEASQIFPQDAIGAIYRGKQLIVVGDSKQMPPSNFFNTTSVQEEDDEFSDDVTDFESILDICATALPQKRLKWHYRSRFEQLISFSNKNFYQNDLVTFPSSKKDALGVGVDYFYVDGIFDRSTKTNRVEAEKIVDLVFENIEKYPERSLGVVAFSISQQNLIDKLIMRRRQFDASKEAFFRSDKEEPFFVKNLETVQGDERDTIIFSVAYGKDQQGRLLLNFGPVNKEGGERRLNVAVTRAKYNVQLVSSMHYTDIDLTRTQSEGARLLREYLDYAENGEIALKRSAPINPLEIDQSEFEMEVCDFLKEKGFEVETKVGCSALKIDIALKHPTTKDYVLAIECDGNTYRASKSARDRDRLRQEVLERMGWKFYRIWSTDWFRNKGVEKQNLLEVAKSVVTSAPVKTKKVEKKTTEVSFEEVVESKPFEFPKYIIADEFKLAEKYDYDRLKVIRAIVEQESPISEEWLLKRVSFLFCREKITSVVRDEYNYLMRNCNSYKITRKDGILYYQGKEQTMLRVPCEKAKNVREIKYIPLEELAYGMKEILKQNLTVEKNGLYKLLVNQLGFSRMGDAICERFERALKLISNDVHVDGDVLSYK